MPKRLCMMAIFVFFASRSFFAQENNPTSVKTKKYDPNTNLVIWPDEFNPEKANWYVEIKINARPEVVWNILIDAKEWHTFYNGVESPVEFFDTSAMVLRNGLVFKMHTIELHHKLVSLHEHWREVIKERAVDNYSQLTEMERQNMKKVLVESLDKFNRSITNLTEQQLNFRPSPEKWTIAECIEHITLAELEFPKILESEMGKPANPKMRKKIRIEDEEIRPKMLSRKWKAKSPEVFKPSNRFTSIEEAVAAFRSQRGNTMAYVETTTDDLRNHYWKHPLTGVIDLYQTLILMSAHLERHIEQIENIKSAEGFPNK